MKWEQLCDDPGLENIPYRVEMMRHDQLIMSPHRSYHSILQSRIIRHLNSLLPQGESLPECPIQTSSGTVVSDVAWASPEKVSRNFDLPCWAECPEIVVEVLSPANTADEIRAKRAALPGSARILDLPPRRSPRVFRPSCTAGQVQDLPEIPLRYHHLG